MVTRILYGHDKLGRLTTVTETHGNEAVLDAASTLATEYAYDKASNVG